MFSPRGAAVNIFLVEIINLAVFLFIALIAGYKTIRVKKTGQDADKLDAGTCSHKQSV
jgi:hypothetical protein